MANTRPRLTKAIADKISNEDTRLVYQIPSGTFEDAEKPVLRYRATLSTGAALPAWLKFNPANQTFTGTPPKDFNGLLAIKVTASDGSLSASDTFNLRIAPVNDAPKLAKAIPDRSVLEEKLLDLQDRARHLHGRRQCRTALQGDAGQRRGATGMAQLQCRQPDLQRHAAEGFHRPDQHPGDRVGRHRRACSTTSTSTSINVNDPTILRIRIPDRHGVKNNGTNKEQFNFRLPDGTFTDADSNIIYTAKLVGGAALPTWLKFDPARPDVPGYPAGEFHRHAQHRRHRHRRPDHAGVGYVRHHHPRNQRCAQADRADPEPDHHRGSALDLHYSAHDLQGHRQHWARLQRDPGE